MLLLRWIFPLFVAAVLWIVPANPVAAGPTTTSPQVTQGVPAVSPSASTDSRVLMGKGKDKGGFGTGGSGGTVVDNPHPRSHGPGGGSTTVPEPSTLLLAGAGLAAYAMGRHKRRIGGS